MKTWVSQLPESCLVSKSFGYGRLTVGLDLDRHGTGCNAAAGRCPQCPGFQTAADAASGCCQRSVCPGPDCQGTSGLTAEDLCCPRRIPVYPDSSSHCCCTCLGGVGTQECPGGPLLYPCSLHLLLCPTRSCRLLCRSGSCCTWG